MKCYDYQKQNCSGCKKLECRYWMDNEESGNCVIAASSNGPLTLQDVGEIFKVTRMRICQIEKNVVKKIQKKISNFI